MAGYRGHLFGATLFFVLYFGALVAVFAIDAAYARFTTLEQLGYPAALFGLCLLFGLWPDVDTDSKGQAVFYSLFFVVDLLLIATRRFEQSAYFGLAALLPILSRHRGWTHTLWAMLVVPSPLLVLPLVLFPERPLSGLPFYGAAVAGYASHLFMDGMLWGKRRR